MNKLISVWYVDNNGEDKEICCKTMREALEIKAECERAYGNAEIEE